MKPYVAAAIMGSAVVLVAAVILVVKPSVDVTFVNLSAAPSSADRAKVEATDFLRTLYAQHDGKHDDFSLLGDQASHWFDPELARLIQADGAGGEAGTLEWDPACDCQDYGRLSAQITVLAADKVHARASVVVTETDPGFDADSRKPRIFTYDLVDIDGRWYIHDVGSPLTPSLRQLMEQARQAESASSSS